MLPAEGIVFLRDFCVYSSERYSGARHGKPATLRRASIYACRGNLNNLRSPSHGTDESVPYEKQRTP